MSVDLVDDITDDLVERFTNPAILKKLSVDQKVMCDILDHVIPTAIFVTLLRISNPTATQTAAGENEFWKQFHTLNIHDVGKAYQAMISDTLRNVSTAIQSREIPLCTSVS